MVVGALGSRERLADTVVSSIPITITGLAVSLAFKMKLWNIGAEGQFHMGAFGAALVVYWFPSVMGRATTILMALSAAACGALWALIAAIPRALFGVNEVVTSLLSNYVAVLWIEHLVYGPWRDPASGFPMTQLFPQAARLPTLDNLHVHIGLLPAVVLVFLVYLIVEYTRWGYEIRVTGDNPKAARFAGIDIERNIVLVFALSGAIAGVAGMIEVSGVMFRLQQGMSPGYGYTAILIAWLAKLNPYRILAVSFLFSILVVGGYSAQLMGVPVEVVYMIQGLILLLTLAGDCLSSRYVARLEKEVLS